MTFKKFILHFRDVDLPIGDLARDIENDLHFPDSNNQEELFQYLRNSSACQAAMITFENAFKYYSSEYL